jgi:anti-sigma factor RsiW
MMCMLHTKEGAGILMDYCARTLNADGVAEVERHLTNCAECRNFVEAQTELWETLDRWTPPEVSTNFDARLYARIAREQAEPAWKRWARRILQPAAPVPIWKPAVSLAAAGMVLALALVVHTPQRRDAGTQVHADSVDIEQVARTLDDLDLLTPSSPM